MRHYRSMGEAVGAAMAHNARMAATLNEATCGKTTATCGTEYPPCARPAGHPEAYCRAADHQAYFIAAEGAR
ncbi:hypothetical protein OG245_15280 [Streptomyces sp. NBC_01116]|uniref:hypothetical protein n=1 Tax=Streptomyces sp. NBC_01116 TaxID=2903752 RepID=UPI00325473EB